jgi:hypothetical protein
MSKFTAEEVATLKAGGNKKAKAVWLAKYDEQKMPPIKPNDVNKIKEKMEKCYEKKEWYDENGKPKAKKKTVKPKTSVAEPPPEDENNEFDDADGEAKEEEKPAAKAKKPAKPVASANVMEDLLNMDAVKEVEANDEDEEGNPFEEEEEQPEEPEDLFAAQPQPGVKPPTSTGKTNTADPPAAFVAAPASTGAADLGAPGSAEAQSVELLIRTLKEIGIKHKFPREKMLVLVDEALAKVGLKAAGAAMPAVAAAPAAVAKPAPAPAPAKPKEPEIDLFAEAEKHTAFSSPTSPLQPLNPSLAARPAPNSGPAMYPPQPAKAAVDNPFEEDDNPFGGSPTPSGNPFGSPTPAAQPFGGTQPFGAAPTPGPYGFAPQPTPGPYGFAPPAGPYGAAPAGAMPFGAPGAFPGYPAQAPGGFPGGPAPMGVYPGYGAPAPAAQPAAAPAAKPAENKKEKDLFKDLGPLF